MGTIRDEIRQTKPFESAADEAVVTLLGTADRVRTALSAVTGAHDVTLQQYNVLRILRGAGPAGIPTLDIAARMIEDSPGITRLLDRLETRGLVRRVRCPEDRRQVLCHATPKALRVLAALEHPLAEAIRHSLAPLNAARTVELVRLLDAVRAAAASFRTETKSQNHETSEKEKKRR
jgi:DNA-binding MarR family transcriptional regulator